MALIALAALIGGASVSGGIAAATGITLLIARKKLNHCSTRLFSADELLVGNHISYKVNGSVQHAIVIEKLNGGVWKLAFLTRIGGDAHLSSEQVNLNSYRSSLYLHEYNPLVCYDTEEVAKRAISLAEDYNQVERHSTIRSYWSFFSDSEHFALWCQTGVSFGKVLHGMFSSDYKYTVVRHVACLRRGDHVCYKIGAVSYEHGIVTNVDVKSAVRVDVIII